MGCLRSLFGKHTSMLVHVEATKIQFPLKFPKLANWPKIGHFTRWKPQQWSEGGTTEQTDNCSKKRKSNPTCTFSFGNCQHVIRQKKNPAYSAANFSVYQPSRTRLLPKIRNGQTFQNVLLFQKGKF